jgi:hypothetical protein
MSKPVQILFELMQKSGASNPESHLAWFKISSSCPKASVLQAFDCSYPQLKKLSAACLFLSEYLMALDNIYPTELGTWISSSSPPLAIRSSSLILLQRRHRGLFMLVSCRVKFRGSCPKRISCICSAVYLMSNWRKFSL